MRAIERNVQVRQNSGTSLPGLRTARGLAPEVLGVGAGPAGGQRFEPERGRFLPLPAAPLEACDKRTSRVSSQASYAS